MAEPTKEDFERVERVARWLIARASTLDDNQAVAQEYAQRAAALRRVLAAAKGEG